MALEAKRPDDALIAALHDGAYRTEYVLAADVE